MRTLIIALALAALTIATFATFGVAAADPSPAVASPPSAAAFCAQHVAAMTAMHEAMADAAWHAQMMAGGQMPPGMPSPEMMGDGWWPDMGGSHRAHHPAPSGTDPNP